MFLSHMDIFLLSLSLSLPLLSEINKHVLVGEDR